jgi:hypothetical protein
MDLREMGCGGIDWINLTQERKRLKVLASMVMTLQIQ